MMYGSWDMEREDRIFSHFGPFFAIFSHFGPLPPSAPNNLLLNATIEFNTSLNLKKNRMFVNDKPLTGNSIPNGKRLSEIPTQFDLSITHIILHILHSSRSCQP